LSYSWDDVFKEIEDELLEDIREEEEQKAMERSRQNIEKGWEINRNIGLKIEIEVLKNRIKDLEAQIARKVPCQKIKLEFKNV